jgi:hypothetical protein
MDCARSLSRTACPREKRVALISFDFQAEFDFLRCFHLISLIFKNAFDFLRRNPCSALSPTRLTRLVRVGAVRLPGQGHSTPWAPGSCACMQAQWTSIRPSLFTTGRTRPIFEPRAPRAGLVRKGQEVSAQIDLPRHLFARRQCRRAPRSRPCQAISLVRDQCQSVYGS